MGWDRADEERVVVLVEDVVIMREAGVFELSPSILY